MENLIGPDTVNTMPEKTLEALLDHGSKARRHRAGRRRRERRKTLDDLRAAGIDVEAVGEQLQKDGVVLFAKSYDELLATIESRRAEAVRRPRG